MGSRHEVELIVKEHRVTPVGTDETQWHIIKIDNKELHDLLSKNFNGFYQNCAGDVQVVGARTIKEKELVLKQERPLRMDSFV